MVLLLVMIAVSNSIEDTEILADKIVKDIREFTDTIGGNKGTLVTFSGNLGAGKTFLAQLIGKKFGVNAVMQSPTFTICRHYEPKDNKFKHIFHLDAYRLEGASDLKEVGFFDALDKDKTLVMLEWPENVKEGLPPKRLDIKLSLLGGDTREINWKVV